MVRIVGELDALDAGMGREWECDAVVGTSCGSAGRGMEVHVAALVELAGTLCAGGGEYAKGRGVQRMCRLGG